MDNEQNFFKLPHYIDQGRIVMGMPLDEILPAACVFAVFAVAKYMMTGLIIGAVIFFLLRNIKQGKGDNFLILILYWFAPAGMSKSIFKHTPSADKRYWLN